MTPREPSMHYRCLPNYLTRCDCTLRDQMLGWDCGVEIKPVAGGSDIAAPSTPTGSSAGAARVSARPCYAGRGSMGAVTMTPQPVWLILANVASLVILLALLALALMAFGGLEAGR